MTPLRVIGVGDNAVDKYLDTNKMYPGGNTTNYSVFAKRAGCDVSYIGWLSSGREGKFVLDCLHAEGVDTSHCRVVEGANAYCLVKLEGTDRVFVHWDMGVGKQIKLNDDDLAYIRQFDLTHSSFYSYTEPELPNLREASKTLSFDFSNDWNKDYLSKMLPYVDLAFLSYSKGSAEETEDLLRWVCGQGARVAVATQGTRGATAFDGQKLYHQPIVPVKVVDTLGAGDAFGARFGIAYLSGVGIETALAQAAQMAAEVCTYFSAWNHETTIE
jgi:fructoselysine 6-kinase